MQILQIEKRMKGKTLQNGKIGFQPKKRKNLTDGNFGRKKVRPTLELKK